MSRFSNKDNDKAVDYSTTVNNDSFDILKRVNEHLEDNEEEEKIKNKSLETDNAELNYQQEKDVVEGRRAVENINKKNTNIGSSILSPLNKANQDADVIQKKDYVSPFSEEFSKKQIKLENSYSEEEEIISNNRLQFYAIFAFIIYIISLCLGYHYTSFENDIPQIVTMEQRETIDYIGQIDSYIATLQTIHSDSIDYIENYTNEIVGTNEFETSIKNSNEKINKMQEEMKDILPPAQYENFHSQLIELYSLQASLNSASSNYGKNKSVEMFNLVQNANDKYEDKMSIFLDSYNSLYYKK